jgi:hypothetical protein
VLAFPELDEAIFGTNANPPKEHALFKGNYIIGPENKDG